MSTETVVPPADQPPTDTCPVCHAPCIASGPYAPKPWTDGTLSAIYYVCADGSHTWQKRWAA